MLFKFETKMSLFWYSCECIYLSLYVFMFYWFIQLLTWSKKKEDGFFIKNCFISLIIFIKINYYFLEQKKKEKRKKKSQQNKSPKVNKRGTERAYLNVHRNFLFCQLFLLLLLLLFFPFFVLNLYWNYEKNQMIIQNVVAETRHSIVDVFVIIVISSLAEYI